MIFDFFIIPAYSKANLEQLHFRKINSVKNKLSFSLSLYKGREKLSLLQLLSFIYVANGQKEQAIRALAKCKLLSTNSILIYTTEAQLEARDGDFRTSKQILKNLRIALGDGYYDQLYTEALIDISMAHIVFGLNCAALELLHKAKMQLNNNKGSNRTNHFLKFCYGLVYYYFSHNGDRGLQKYYAQLCADKLTPLLKISHYKNVCGLYLWKLQVRTSGILGPIPSSLLSTGYAKYQVGKECIKVGSPHKGLSLLHKTLEVSKVPDVYYWIGEGMVQIADKHQGFDAMWVELLERCPVYDKPPNNEQESGISPPPPTAVSIYRKDRARRLALTSPSNILKLIEKIDQSKKCAENEDYCEAQAYYRKALATSPVLVEEYCLSLAKLMIYLNNIVGAEAILSEIVSEISSPFVLFDASLLLATCFSQSKVLAASEHICRCLALLPKLPISKDKIDLLMKWAVYYANYHVNRKNQTDLKYWVDQLTALGYENVEQFADKITKVQESEKLLRSVGARWFGKKKDAGGDAGGEDTPAPAPPPPAGRARARAGFGRLLMAAAGGGGGDKDDK